MANETIYDGFSHEKPFLMESIANSGGLKMVSLRTIYLLMIVPLTNEY